MTVTESTHVNTLVNYLLHLRCGRQGRAARSCRRRPPTEADVRDALTYLADRAYRRMMAGTDGAEVRSEWVAADGERVGLIQALEREW